MTPENLINALKYFSTVYIYTLSHSPLTKRSADKNRTAAVIDFRKQPIDDAPLRVFLKNRRVLKVAVKNAELQYKDHVSHAEKRNKKKKAELATTLMTESFNQ